MKALCVMDGGPAGREGEPPLRLLLRAAFDRAFSLGTQAMAFKVWAELWGRQPLPGRGPGGREEDACGWPW